MPPGDDDQIDTTAVSALVTALQATFEAFNEVARGMPEDRRRNLDANLNRIRQARAELMNWMDENR